MSIRVKKILIVILMCALFVGGLRVVRYIDTNDIQSYTRLMFHELYESEENIDVLVVGASYVFRGFVPSVADEILDAYTFDGSSALQDMDGSYAVIKEAVAHHDISQIILEVSYTRAIQVPYLERTGLTNIYIISDYIRDPINRLTYIFQGVNPSYYINTFCIARRNWRNLLDVEETLLTVQNKQLPQYKNYQFVLDDAQTERYVERGYISSDTILSDDYSWYSHATEDLVLEDISEDYLRNLTAIVDLCKENDIELTFLMSPMTEALVVSLGTYDDYSAYMQALADDWGIELINFNYVRNEYFDTTLHSNFKDEKHVSTPMAATYTTLLCQYLTGEISREELFYDSLADKIADEAPTIYGVEGIYVAYEDTEGQVISNVGEGYEFQVTVIDATGNETIVKAYDADKTFVVRGDGTNSMRIECRDATTLEVVATYSAPLEDAVEEEE